MSYMNGTIYAYNNEIYSPLAVLQYIDALQKNLLRFPSGLPAHTKQNQ